MRKQAILNYKIQNGVYNEHKHDYIKNIPTKTES